MSSRFPSLRGVLKWPPTVAAIIATSSLFLALVAVSHHIWRGGGKKAKDPDWTDSRKRSREKINKEKKRSLGERSSATSKEDEFLWEEPPKRTRLSKEAEVLVTIEINPDVLTEKSNSLFNIAEENEETVTTKIVYSVLAENEGSQPKLPKKTKTKVAVNEKPIVLEEKSQVQALELEEIEEREVRTWDKLINLTEKSEPQPKATKESKTEVPTQEKDIILEGKPQAQHKVEVSLETNVTTQIKPVEKLKSQLNKVHEIDIKERLLKKEVKIEIESSNHTLSNDFTDDKLEESENSENPVSGVNQELTQQEKTAEDSLGEKNLDNIGAIEVTSISEKLKQEAKSQILEGDNYSVFRVSGEPRKGVVESCDQAKLISQAVLTLISCPTKTADTEIISDSKTLEKPFETESNVIGAVKKLESISVSLPCDKQAVKSVKIEESQLEKVQEVQVKSTDNISGADKHFNLISSSAVDETVKIVNSVICDSSEPLVIQQKSLDSLHNSNKEEKFCSASLETNVKSVTVVNPVGIKKPLKAQLRESNYIDDTDNTLKDSCTLPLEGEHTREIVNSVISGVGELQINQLKSSNDIKSDDKQLRDSPTVEKVIEGVISSEGHSGIFHQILFSSSGQPEGAEKHLKDISDISSRTEKSMDIVSGEKVVKSKQVTLASGSLDSEGASCEEVLLKEQEVSDSLEEREGGKTNQNEEKKSPYQGGAVSEVAVVALEGTAEHSIPEKKVTKLCLENSGSSALEDQVEIVTVKPSCPTVAGLTEEVSEVCPVVKDLSKTPETNTNNSDQTLANKAEGRKSVDKEVPLYPLEKEDMLTKGTEAKSDSKGKSGSGKRKGKKGKIMLHEDPIEKMVEKMEVKEIMRESEESILQNGDVGEEHSGKSSRGHASGISSPPTPNFPDNRSEGSSCGDSGKGRSDVTTPGGLEEELREVNFSHHFSPPCSTSGPEEEEERVRRASGSTAEDGSREEIGSAIGVEEIVENAAIVVGNDGLVMPVPVPIYHGMVPITPPPSVYEFVIPQGLVGRLIGKHGSFVNLIKARTSATIFIKTHPETNKLKVCAIEGTDDEIQDALDMIREKFPLRRYSSMTLEQVFFLPLPPPTFTLIPDSLPLQLVEGVSNDVILSALVSPSHYFLQQPTHPTYPTLAKLDMWMAMCYQDANAPMLPEDVKAGIICAAPTMGGWYRAQIVAVEEIPSTSEDESVEEGELIKLCDVRFVDYGGYERMPSHSLRQIRSDFMTLPFQASECYLAHVVPPPTSEENKMADGWSMEALALVEELTQAQVLQAQVVGQATDGIPLVMLYAFSHSLGQVVQVNNELVNHGLAVWAVPVVETDLSLFANGSENLSGDDTPQEDQPEIAVA